LENQTKCSIIALRNN